MQQLYLKRKSLGSSLPIVGGATGLASGGHAGLPDVLKDRPDLRCWVDADGSIYVRDGEPNRV